LNTKTRRYLVTVMIN